MKLYGDREVSDARRRCTLVLLPLLTFLTVLFFTAIFYTVTSLRGSNQYTYNESLDLAFYW